MPHQKLYQHIENLWQYMQLNQAVEPADCIFVLGSNDIRVAEHAAALYLKGYAKTIIFSGGCGRLTEGLFDKSEAETFAQAAIDLGVPRDAIMTESEASNTGENVRFTATMLDQQGRHFQTFILVQKPYMERRTLATFEKQWPMAYQKVYVSSPAMDFVDYFNDDIDLDTTVRAMLGDYERIKSYPEKGFQIEQMIPSEVEFSYQTIRAVFD